jgi:hypothetical protein
MILTLLALALAGCATRVKMADKDLDPRFTADFATTMGVALAGVTVAPPVGAILAPADAADAEEALYRAFLGGRPDLQTWSVPTVTDLAGQETIAALQDQYGRFGRLRADHLQPLATALEGNRYLAVARLLADEISSSSLKTDPQDPEARIEGRAEHENVWETTVTTERAVTVSLEIFDLARGLSVWRAEARSRGRMRYEYEAPSTGAADLQERLASAAEVRYLEREGGALKVPDLVQLMETALGELVGRLPGP